jgi:hypothetical protein
MRELPNEFVFDTLFPSSKESGAQNAVPAKDLENTMELGAVVRLIACGHPFDTKVVFGAPGCEIIEDRSALFTLCEWMRFFSRYPWLRICAAVGTENEEHLCTVLMTR